MDKVVKWCKYKNDEKINTWQIELLSKYKYTEYYNDTIQLILKLYDKRPDLIMDFYFSITRYMLYDANSINMNYKQEYELLKSLFEAANNGENYNNSILFIYVAEKALVNEITDVKMNELGTQIEYVVIPLMVNEELKKLRTFIVEALGVLYKQDVYFGMVFSVFENIHVTHVKENDFLELFMSDFSAIHTFFRKKGNIGFEDAKIIGKYEEFATNIGVSLEGREKIALENKEYEVYHIFSKQSCYAESFEENDNYRMNLIKKYISKFTLDEYQNLFGKMVFLEKNCSKDSWDLAMGLDIMFDSLKSDTEKYIAVFRKYLKSGAPFVHHLKGVLPYMLDKYGYDVTYSEINHIDFKEKAWWLNCMWELVAQDKITNTIAEQYYEFLQNNFRNDSFLIPCVFSLKKYFEYKPGMMLLISNVAIKDRKYVRRFLRGFFKENEVNYLENVFQSNMDILEKLYFVGKGEHFDYHGYLFGLLYRNDKTVWERYVLWLKTNVFQIEYEYKIFEYIWMEEDYFILIEFAFKELLDDSFRWITDDTVKIIFANYQETSMEIKNRKRKWIERKLGENYNDMQQVGNLIDIVNYYYPKWSKEIILSFLQKIKDFTVLKKIKLFPTSEHFTGSEIPYVDKKIGYLTKLLENLHGIEYIEHKEYLKEKIRQLEYGREEIEKREYLANMFSGEEII